jgi:hypothetical protein
VICIFIGFLSLVYLPYFIKKYIHKKGGKNKCENCRGITLLSVASKLYGNLLKNKLNKYIEVYLKHSSKYRKVMKTETSKPFIDYEEACAILNHAVHSDEKQFHSFLF